MIRAMGHFPRIGGGEGEWRYWLKTLVDKLKGRDNLEDLGIVGSVIWNCIVGKSDVNMWTRINWIRVGSIVGLLQTR
jgi:hypothetical protein